MWIFTLISVVLSIFLSPISAQTSSFPDVLENQWFYEYVMTIKDWGIVEGNDDGTFAPARNINRAEFSKMLTLYDERVDQKILAQNKNLVTRNFFSEILGKVDDLWDEKIDTEISDLESRINNNLSVLHNKITSVPAKDNTTVFENIWGDNEAPDLSLPAFETEFSDYQDEINSQIATLTSQLNAQKNESGATTLAAGPNTKPATVMYLNRFSAAPAECPPDWSEVSFGPGGKNGIPESLERVCIINQACEVAYLDKFDDEAADCPAGWKEADYSIYWSSYKDIKRRTCFICSP